MAVTDSMMSVGATSHGMSPIMRPEAASRAGPSTGLGALREATLA